MGNAMIAWNYGKSKDTKTYQILIICLMEYFQISQLNNPCTNGALVLALLCGISWRRG